MGAMMLSAKTIKTIAVWFLGVVALGLLSGWVYAVKTSWQNETRLVDMESDLKVIKRSLIRLSLKSDPTDPTVATDLLSGTPVQQGIGEFRAGEFPAAYSIWSQAAATGDVDSAYAIFEANAALKRKAQDSTLQHGER